MLCPRPFLYTLFHCTFPHSCICVSVRESEREGERVSDSNGKTHTKFCCRLRWLSAVEYAVRSLLVANSCRCRPCRRRCALYSRATNTSHTHQHSNINNIKKNIKINQKYSTHTILFCSWLEICASFGTASAAYA